MEERIKNLYGTHQFPVDSVVQNVDQILPEVRRLDAYQFSGYDSPNVSFGMDPKKCADVLRAIAERVESGEYILQSGGVFTYAQRDEYHMTVVNVKFHAKKVSVDG